MRRKKNMGLPEEPEHLNGDDEANEENDGSLLPTPYRAEEDAITLDVPSLKKKLKAINDFQLLVRENLHEGIDFGTIPGTQKPTLYKPGAEKITKLLGLADTFETEDEKLDFKTPFFSFDIKCRLVSIRSGVVVSEGVGHANSMESRWRYRWVYENKLTPQQFKEKDSFKTKKWQKDGRWITQYQVENEDIFSLVNTIKKMAKKRAHVDAALSAGRLSDLFTQDVEDLKDHIEIEEVSEPKAKPQPKQAPVQKPTPKTEPKPEPKPEPSQAAPPKQEPADPKKAVIERIKSALAELTIDPKRFKVFLADFQQTHKVKFVAENQYRKLSFNEGDKEDLDRLRYHIKYMTSQFIAWEKEQASGKIEAPFDEASPSETDEALKIEGEDEEGEEEEGSEEELGG